MNGATFAAGKVGQAFRFDGIDDHIAVANQPNISTAFTFTAWANFDANNFDNFQSLFNNNQFFIRKNGATEGNSLAFFVKLQDFSLAPRAQSATIPIPGNWYHVAGTWDGKDSRIYINGRLEDRQTGQGTLTPVSTQASIGRGEQNFVTANPFSGRIDDVRIYDQALSSEQIAEIYRNGI